MDVRYINPFLVSIQDLFKTMINVPFSLGKPRLKQDTLPVFEISSIIGVSGTITGSVVISFSKPVALQIASALLGEEIHEVNEDCKDAIGEVANIIAGGAKKDFPTGDNSISVPTVVIGKHEVSYPRGVPIITIPCEVSSGRLTIDVALKKTKVPSAVPC